MRRAVILILLALPAGCAATEEWERAATSATQRAADERECLEAGERRAFDESFRNRVYFTLPAPTVQAPSYFERGIDTARFAAECMRQRGYRLVPKAG